jgi:hypothetical protein
MPTNKVAAAMNTAVRLKGVISLVHGNSAKRNAICATQSRFEKSDGTARCCAFKVRRAEILIPHLITTASSNLLPRHQKF